MAKKIVQYSYFGEDSVISGYTECKIKDATEFERRIKQKNLFIYNKILKVYNVLDDKQTYNDKETYYEVVPGERINHPVTINKAMLISGSVFNNITPIVKLGVQAIPGTKFRVNANKDWIIVGMTGIYELDLTNSSAMITKLQFDETSLNIIDKNENAYLIIDIMSEQEGSNT